MSPSLRCICAFGMDWRVYRVGLMILSGSSYRREWVYLGSFYFWLPRSRSSIVSSEDLGCVIEWHIEWSNVWNGSPPDLCHDRSDHERLLFRRGVKLNPSSPSKGDKFSMGKRMKIYMSVVFQTAVVHGNDELKSDRWWRPTRFNPGQVSTDHTRSRRVSPYG